MNGSRTPESVRLEFRAAYLYSGNASATAKKLGIPERTGRELAKELCAEADFAEARRALRAQYLDDLVALRMRVVTKATERFLGGLPIPKVEEGGNVTIIDKRPDYGKLVLDAEKNAQNLARLDAEKSGDIPTEREVVIRVSPVPIDPAVSGAKQSG